MKRMKRREWFGLFTRRAEPPPSRSFLEDFYAQRTPQKLPPIVLRDSVIHYPVSPSDDSRIARDTSLGDDKGRK